jgi:CHAD domain-containing protein
VLKKPGISPDDTMAEAASKTLLYHLQRMMRHESGTREGKDPEELHDMRVAVRRMRAAVRVFADYLDRGALKPYMKTMRQTGRQLGTVRDLDVFRMKAQKYVDSVPPGQEAALDPLLGAWEEEREKQRADLVSFLDDDRYESFKKEFESFLRGADLGVTRRVSDDGEPLPTKIRDVLPHVLLERLAAVRAYDESITSGAAPVLRFHQLRITTKSLRYNLEFFQEVLGPKSKSLIDITKLVQDHLGDLQDASVTCEVLLGFLASGTWGRARGKAARSLPVNAPGVATYLAVKQEEIERLMQTFEPVWRRIRGPQFSRRLATLVGAL